jgi:hypothetical protein
MCDEFIGVDHEKRISHHWSEDLIEEEVGHALGGRFNASEDGASRHPKSEEYEYRYRTIDRSQIHVQSPEECT